MAAAAASVRSLPPGYRFVPKEKELVESYLLPRARGLPDPFPGVDITADAADASTPPWKLFKRHGRGDDDEPYFWVRGDGENAKAGGARQHRLVDGGFKWKSQRCVPGVLDVGGEKIKWTNHMLSLQRGDGGGSLGWVMHEYAIVEPSCVAVRICHIAFTGRGQKRKRVPAGCDGCESEPESQRLRHDVAEPSESWTARNFDQETEQVPGAMGQFHGGDFLDQSAADQNTHFAAATAVASPPDSWMTSGIGQEAEQIGQEAEYLDDGEDCLGGSAPHEAQVAVADASLGTPTFDQGYSDAAQAPAVHAPSDDFITEMVEEMIDPEANLEWNDQVSTSEQQIVMTQSSSAVQEPIVAQNVYEYPRLCGMLGMAAGPMDGGFFADLCF